MKALQLLAVDRLNYSYRLSHQILKCCRVKLVLLALVFLAKR